MTYAVPVIATVAFPIGGVIAVFIILVAGICKDDLPGARNGPLDVLTSMTPGILAPR